MCLNVGCIPSKALLHVAQACSRGRGGCRPGITFGEPQIDSTALRDGRSRSSGKLTGGLDGLAKQRKVKVVQGEATFASPNVLRSRARTARRRRLRPRDHRRRLERDALPFLPDDPRIMDSTGALELEDVPERLLVVGGGIIGLEMATVYDALGSRGHGRRALDGLIPGADKDLVRPLQKRIESATRRSTSRPRSTAVEAGDDGLRVTFEGDGAPEPQTFDRILLAVGRRPNGALVGAEHAGVAVDERGFIAVDAQMRTNVPHIFAIGDVVGEPMLAHKATHEGKVAAEVIAGHNVAFDAKAIPSVAYTDPEVAWIGLNGDRGQGAGHRVREGALPVGGVRPRARLGRDEGLTKLLVDPETRRVLGAGWWGRTRAS